MCEWPIAPGWKAVIWLLSRSVVMKAWPVCSGCTLAHVLARDAVPVQPLRIGGEVVPDGGHDVARVAQQLQVVGDVAGAAAELAAHLQHQERHVQHVQLVGQDVVPEVVLEHHDGVEGHRAADQRLAGLDHWLLHDCLTRRRRCGVSGPASSSVNLIWQDRREFSRRVERSPSRSFSSECWAGSFGSHSGST